MQQFMGLVRVRLTQELVVQLLYLGILMGLAQLLALVFTIQGSCPLCAEGVLDIIIFTRQEAGTDDRLTATGDTTTGATHDLDKVVLRLALADLVQQHLGIFIP